MRWGASTVATEVVLMAAWGSRATPGPVESWGGARMHLDCGRKLQNAGNDPASHWWVALHKNAARGPLVTSQGDTDTQQTAAAAAR